MPVFRAGLYGTGSPGLASQWHSIVLMSLVFLASFGRLVAQELETQSPDILPATYYPGERHEHSNRPAVPSPQHPLPSTEENVDTSRPFLDWQHGTDDWFGLRPTLDDHGIVFEASLTSDFSYTPRRGLSPGRSFGRHLFDLNLTLSSDRLCGWPGGTFFLDFQTNNGPIGSLIVGDLQGFSNIDAEGRTQFPQVWLEQRLFESALRLKVGKVDANSEFAYVSAAGEFLNSSMGFSPTIFVFPSYPDPATAINLFWEPLDWSSLGFGMYDGSGQRGIATGTRFPITFIPSRGPLFFITELTGKWALPVRELSGRGAMGVWYHSGDFERFTGGAQAGTWGWYSLLEQQLYQENPGLEEDDQGVEFFLQLGHADPRVSGVHYHLGGGLLWRGAIPGLDRDSRELGSPMLG